ncbi:hypothetical protein TYRP_017503 [Tyrophagus putrescentiae]|nr:hypothetical protein TYRP_017503 [Tyrophagus putrescentiae]
MSKISPNYQLKRKLVMCVCLLKILLCIILAALSHVITKYIVDHTANINTLTPSQRSTVETIATVDIIVSSVIGILFQLLGLIGAWKENVCLSITYGVVNAIGAFFAVVMCFLAPLYIISTLLALGTATIVVLFIIDLRKMKNGLDGTAQLYYA